MNTTDDHPTDELAMPHFEEQLWAEIRAQHSQGAWIPTPIYGRAQSTVPTLVRPRTVYRRGMRRSLAAAAVLAVIAVAAALSSFGTSSAPPDTSEQPPAGTLPSHEKLATLTIAAIDEALADSIVHQVTDNSTMARSEVWYDETTGAERHVLGQADGSPRFDVGFAAVPGPGYVPSGTAVIREVNHCFSEYSETEQPWLAPTTKAQEIRDQLDDGTLVVDGTEVVEGRELIRVLHPSPEGFPADTDAVIHVDPTSYQPVLQRLFAGTPEASTTTFEYLPRTPENLALLVPTVPSGFTQKASVDDKRTCP